MILRNWKAFLPSSFFVYISYFMLQKEFDYDESMYSFIKAKEVIHFS